MWRKPSDKSTATHPSNSRMLGENMVQDWDWAGPSSSLPPGTSAETGRDPPWHVALEKVQLRMSNGYEAEVSREAEMCRAAGGWSWQRSLSMFTYWTPPNSWKGQQAFLLLQMHFGYRLNLFCYHISIQTASHNQEERWCNRLNVRPAVEPGETGKANVSQLSTGHVRHCLCSSEELTDPEVMQFYDGNYILLPISKCMEQYCNKSWMEAFISQKCRL